MEEITEILGAVSTDDSGSFGTIHAVLYDQDGNIKFEETIKNKITDAGDLYQATRVCAGINSNGVSQPTLVNGMKLGNGTTTESKSGAGAAIVTYLTGSNSTFDSGFPTVNNLGAGAGVSVTYQVTWPAGTATSTTINEVVICNDAATNATSTAANTISRGVFLSTVNKLSTDIFVCTWAHKQLGA